MQTIKRWAGHLLLVIAGLLIVVTLLPIIQTNQWWVRVWDYPRVQLVALCLIILLLLFVVLPKGGRTRLPLFGALVIATAFHAWRIAPYTLPWPLEIATARVDEHDACVSILIANVLMENRQSKVMLNLLRREKPDIVFVVENDSWWSDQLNPLKSEYATVIDNPLDNTYGLLFMTRLDSDDVQLRHLTNPNIPSVRARLHLPSGEPFTFHGLHPKPPRIGQDSDLRDHELMTIARQVRQEDSASIVGGDLNDVAWSHTTRLFKRISRMLDPRQGRGLYASYHADYPVLRWPLDHVFATKEFVVKRIAVLEHTGSDHFPVLAQFCLQNKMANDNAEQESMQGDDREEMQETLSSD